MRCLASLQLREVGAVDHGYRIIDITRPGMDTEQADLHVQHEAI